MAADQRLDAAAQLYAQGQDARGDALVAELALDGVDVTGFGWGWLHSGEPDLLEERLASIRRIVLDRYSDLTPIQRARARDMLCSDDPSCDLDDEAAALRK